MCLLNTEYKRNLKETDGKEVEIWQQLCIVSLCIINLTVNFPTEDNILPNRRFFLLHEVKGRIYLQGKTISSTKDKM